MTRSRINVLICSFLIFNFDIPSDVLQKANELLQLRGPDQTNVVTYDSFTFVHNLLHITGPKTMQPFAQGNIIALYNGEIYNYRDFLQESQSDGECLIPLYKKFGPEFIRKLDGEFAICVFDFDRNILVMATDVFRTKPLFYGKLNGKFGIASYKSSLQTIGFSEISQAPCNTILIFDLSTSNVDLIERKIVYKFDLSQHKLTYDDWFAALERSIQKRAKHNNFISLSSGYDSGLIACVMNRLGLHYDAISFDNGRENRNVVNARKKICPGRFYLIKWMGTLKYQYLTFLNNVGKGDLKESQLKNESAAIFATAFVMDVAKRNKNRVHLCGTGVDEIISDYYGGTLSRNFGGMFPENLSQIFPEDPWSTSCIWKNFYEGCLSSNLWREEFIGGLYGIENRYPFLDTQVVQEFLWLHPTLKNKAYKAPLKEYLKMYQYPFDENKKVGFSS